MLVSALARSAGVSIAAGRCSARRADVRTISVCRATGKDQDVGPEEGGGALRGGQGFSHHENREELQRLGAVVHEEINIPKQQRTEARNPVEQQASAVGYGPDGMEPEGADDDDTQRMPTPETPPQEVSRARESSVSGIDDEDTGHV